MCDLSISQFGFSTERLLPVTLGEIKETVKDSDPLIEEDSEEFRAGVILLSSVFVGPTIGAVKEFTRYNKYFISRIYRNLRESRIWGGPPRGKGDRWVDSEEWEAEDGGNIAFWLHVLCGLGEVKRGRDDRYRQV